MKNKLAKLKYMPNNFQIIEEGDHVICAISKKIIPLPSSTDFAFITVALRNRNAPARLVIITNVFIIVLF